MTNQKYHISIRILHWIMALIIILIVAGGFYMTSLPNNDETRMSIMLLHKSFGIIILFLVLIRIICRLTTKIPTLPNTMPKLIQKASKSGHITLYILMIIMPVSGYLMSTYFEFAVKLFNFHLPALVEFNPKYGRFFNKVHYYSSFIFSFVIAVHVAAVIKHRFFDKKENNILNRMI